MNFAVVHAIQAFWRTKRLARRLRTRTDVARWRDARLQHFLSKVIVRAPFYAGVHARRLEDLPILDKPMVLAKFLQIAGVGEADRVLDVGAATGYSSAVLSYVAGSVVGVELDSTLARQAVETVRDVASAPVEIVQGPLEAGCAARAPYDVIIINGAIEELPQTLCDQLRDGGRLMCVLGTGPASKAMLYRRDGAEMSGRPVFDAAAAALPGFAKVPAFAF